MDYPILTHEIYKSIRESRRKPDSIVLRASSMGYCTRKLGYKKLGIESKDYPARTDLVFTTGKCVEISLKNYLKMACGDGKPYESADFGTLLQRVEHEGEIFEFYSQPTWTNTELGYTGHADIIFKKHNGSYALGEIKSTTPYGINEIKGGSVGDYIYQAHALMMTDEARKLGINQYHFIYLDKLQSNMFDRVFDYDSRVEFQIKEKIKKVNACASIETLPEKDFHPEVKKTKKETYWVLPWQCSYCPYVEKCNPDFILDFKEDQWGTSKPIYKRDL